MNKNSINSDNNKNNLKIKIKYLCYDLKELKKYILQNMIIKLLIILLKDKSKIKQLKIIIRKIYKNKYNINKQYNVLIQLKLQLNGKENFNKKEALKVFESM